MFLTVHSHLGRLLCQFSCLTEPKMFRQDAISLYRRRIKQPLVVIPSGPCGRSPVPIFSWKIAWKRHLVYREVYLVISLLVLRIGCGIWLYQFLINAYLFTLFPCLEISRVLLSCLLEPCHYKTCLYHMRTTKTQISLRIRAVWSASLLFV